MPMFPLRRNYAPQQATQVMPVQDQYDPLQQGQTRRRRGLFGGQARGVVRREDGDPGTALNYFLFGREGVQGMRDSRMQRDIFNNSIRSQKIEDATAESAMTQRVQRDRVAEEYIASLPIEQQARARTAYAIDPEAFAESLSEQMSGGGWQVGQGYSHAFRIRPDGSRETGAELPLRPRAPIQGYILPGDSQDWEYADD